MTCAAKAKCQDKSVLTIRHTDYSPLDAGLASLSDDRLGAGLIVGFTAPALRKRDTCYAIGHRLPGRPIRVRAAAVREQTWQDDPELGVAA